MSLQVTPSRIIVDSSGDEIFDSSDKLVYKKAIVSGTGVTLSAADQANNTSDEPVRIDLWPASKSFEQNDFYIIFIKPTATTGNVLDSTIIGSWIQLSFALMVDFRTADNDAFIRGQDFLTGWVEGRPYDYRNNAWDQTTWLRFEMVGHALRNSYWRTDDQYYPASAFANTTVRYTVNPSFGAGNSTITFDWKVVILSYM